MSRSTSEPGPGAAPGDGVWPAVAVGLGGLLVLFYAVPLAVLLVRAPGAVRVDGSVVGAAATSVATAAASTALATVVGVPLAYRLARAQFRGKRAVTGLVALPLVLPPVVSGLLLLSAFGPAGLGGLVGVRTAGTHAGVVLAQTFVASPFVVVVGQAAFEGVDPRLEAAARTLGRSRFDVFRRVALPLAARGVLAGVTLAFARAIGEFGATLLLA
jgi:molybdate/tungstate transport system permease protein